MGFALFIRLLMFIFYNDFVMLLFNPLVCHINVC